jgi:membrane-bound lytic murein transglycosylase B
MATRHGRFAGLVLAAALVLSASSAAPAGRPTAAPVSTGPVVPTGGGLGIGPPHLAVVAGSVLNASWTEPPSPSTAEPAPAALSPAEVERAGTVVPTGTRGIPGPVAAAYRRAAERMAREAPGCHLSWELLAGIGRIESGHASGGRVDATGTTRGRILGPRLDGRLPGAAVIPDGDGGALDGDPLFDRAVGPMQFLPRTWRTYGADGNGDGVRNPNNVYDASLAAARYLCAAGGNIGQPRALSAALFRYNRSAAYGLDVLAWAQTYRTGATSVPARTDPVPAPPEVPARPPAAELPAVLAAPAPGPGPARAAPDAERTRDPVVPSDTAATDAGSAGGTGPSAPASPTGPAAAVEPAPTDAAPATAAAPATDAARTPPAGPPAPSDGLSQAAPTVTSTTEATRTGAAPTSPTDATPTKAAPSSPTDATPTKPAPSSPTAAAPKAAPSSPTGAAPTGAAPTKAAPSSPTDATPTKAAPSSPTAAAPKAVPSIPTGAASIEAAPARAAPSSPATPTPAPTCSAEPVVLQPTARSTLPDDAGLLLRFALPERPAGCGVIAATLRLSPGDAAARGSFTVLRAAERWPQGASAVPATAGPAVVSAPEPGRRSVPVTGLVAALYTGPDHGLLVRPEAGPAPAGAAVLQITFG